MNRVWIIDLLVLQQDMNFTPPDDWEPLRNSLRNSKLSKQVMETRSPGLISATWTRNEVAVVADIPAYTDEAAVAWMRERLPLDWADRISVTAEDLPEQWSTFTPYAEGAALNTLAARHQCATIHTCACQRPAVPDLARWRRELGTVVAL